MQAIEGINHEDDSSFKAFLETRKKLLAVKIAISEYNRNKTGDNWNKIVRAAIELFGEELVQTKFRDEQKDDLRLEWITNQCSYIEMYNTMSWQIERQRRYNLLQYTQYLHI